jgi:hypothetical protein
VTIPRLSVPIIALATLNGPAHAQQADAVFAGGCFWGVQWVFEHVRGVTSVVSGYSGGSVANPTYELVGTGVTGHAESVLSPTIRSESRTGSFWKSSFVSLTIRQRATSKVPTSVPTIALLYLRAIAPSSATLPLTSKN